MSVDEKTKGCESPEREASDTSCPASTSPMPDHDCSKEKDGPSCGKMDVLKEILICC